MKELPYKNTTIEDMEGELWVDAFGFDGYYEVSNLGRIKSVSQREVMFGRNYRIMPIKIIKQAISKKYSDGRLTCGFCIDNKRISINIPRLIYQSFHTEEYIEDKVISHVNRNEDDNRLSNLIAESIRKNHSDNVNVFNCKDMKQNLISNNQKKHNNFTNNIKVKICRICGIEKDISEFQSKKIGKRDENRNICRQCRNTQAKERYHIRKNK